MTELDVAGKKVLFIEDEAPFRQFAGSYLEENGFRVTYAGDAAQGLQLFADCEPDLILLDLNLPDLHGLEVLRRLRMVHPDLRVVVLTAYGDAKNAVDALKAGATDYLTKPVELDHLVQVARQAVAASSAIGAQAAAEGSRTDVLPAVRPAGLVKEAATAIELVGAHPAWRKVLDRLERVVESDFNTLLLLGESGTGKTAIARRYHELSPRRSGPFVEIDCPSIPEALLESELFGYERGAFTGAAQRKRGQIELAAGGTLFLDEIGELPQGLQPKLLRFLEHRTFRRVGGLENLEADVRLVCATNRDLRQMVEAGTFRRDLFYRLEVVSIQLPALRERADDMLLIADHFLKAFAVKTGQPAPSLDDGARQALREHSFPGNIRELKNLIQRAVAFADAGQVLGAADLDLSRDGLFSPGASSDEGAGRLLHPVDLEATLNAIEAHYVELALTRSASQREAGTQLGLDRFALARRRNRIARMGGADRVRRIVDAAPSWVTQLLGGHPGDLPQGGLDLQALRAELEARVIAKALRASDNNRARAATLVGMSRTSLSRRLDGPAAKR